MNTLWIDSKYAAQLVTQLSQFRKIKDNVWNFRCPICGDSKKDQTKARGYFYPYKQNLRFRCHNCGSSKSFYKFLESQDVALFREYKLERFKELNSGNAIQSHKPVAHIYNQPKKKRKGLGFPSIDELPKSHAAVVYVDSRHIPERHKSNIFYAENMGKVANTIDGYENTRFDDYPRILLPFINSNGIMTHIQGRAIDTVPKSKRYITLEIVKNVPKIYGLSNISEGRKIYIVEGPIDSLFLRNCIGMGGADINYSLFIPDNTVFIFDNEPRNPEIIKRMNRTIENGFGVCIWGEEIKEKDINDLIIMGMTSGEIKNYINDHTYRGAKAKMAMIGYRKC